MLTNIGRITNIMAISAEESVNILINDVARYRMALEAIGAMYIPVDRDNRVDRLMQNIALKALKERE